MGLLRRKIAERSNIQFTTVQPGDRREPVFTDTRNGVWRAQANEQGEPTLVPIGEHAYSPEFDPELPHPFSSMTAVPHSSISETAPAQPTKRTDTRSWNEYFGGFNRSDIDYALQVARVGVPTDIYRTTADTAQLQQGSEGQRPYYCTAPHLDDLIARHADAESMLKNVKIKVDRALYGLSETASPEEKKERASWAKSQLAPYVARLQMLENRKKYPIVVDKSPTFNKTSMVQPGHIVTLRSKTPEGSTIDKKYYLLSHPNEQIEAEHIGIEHVPPHSFLGRELLLKSRGDDINAVELAGRDDARFTVPWSDYGIDQSIDKFEQRNKRSVTPEEDARFKARPGERVNFGSIVNIETPSAAALNSAGTPTFNSSSGEPTFTGFPGPTQPKKSEDYPEGFGAKKL